MTLGDYFSLTPSESKAFPAADFHGTGMFGRRANKKYKGAQQNPRGLRSRRAL